MKTKSFKFLAVVMVAAVLLCSMPFTLGAVSNPNNARVAAVDVSAINSFLNTAYNKSGFTAYDGSNTENYFKMSGRTCYQGFTFNKENIDTYVTFNVENINSITFTVGHLDGKTLSDKTLQVYRDGDWWRDIELKANGVPQTITLDVTGNSTLRFYIKSWYSYYGFTDIIIDGKTSMACDIPEYEDINAFLNGGYDRSGYNVFDGSNEFTNFKMSGRTCYQGFTLDKENIDTYVTFNVENINSITFTVGHLDGKTLSDKTLQVYRDGDWWRDIELEANGLPQTITLDVTGNSTLRFFIKSWYSYYGFTDIIVDEKTSKECDVPEYTDVNALLNSGYDRSGYNVFDGSNEFTYFKISGRTCYQGFTLDKENIDTYVTFNVENINSITFTVGHLDGKSLTDKTLQVYRDGNWWQDIELKANGVPQTITLDVSDNSTLRFFIKSWYSYYGFTDIIIDEKTSMACDVPEYEDVNTLLNNGYDGYGYNIYDGSNEFNYFKMSGRTFTQGFTLDRESNDAQVTFNTENLDRLNLCVGHLDDTRAENKDLVIYKDGVEYYTIHLEANSPVKYYTINLQNVQTLRFYIKSWYVYYGFADITLNDELAEGKTISDYTDIDALWLAEHPEAQATEPATTVEPTEAATQAPTTVAPTQPATQRPTQAVTQPNYEFSEYLIGDMNFDGKVDSKDRIFLTRCLAKWKGYELPGTVQIVQ